MYFSFRRKIATDVKLNNNETNNSKQHNRHHSMQRRSSILLFVWLTPAAPVTTPNNMSCLFIEAITSCVCVCVRARVHVYCHPYSGNTVLVRVWRRRCILRMACRPRRPRNGIHENRFELVYDPNAVSVEVTLWPHLICTGSDVCCIVLRVVYFSEI